MRTRDPDDARRLLLGEFDIFRGEGKHCFDAHCILVRNRGVTSTVATSAARLVMT